MTLRVHNIYQSQYVKIKSPHRRLQYFYWVENSVHLKYLQPRGRRWEYHGDVTSITRVAHYYFM